MVILAYWLQITGCHCEGIPNAMTEAIPSDRSDGRNPIGYHHLG